MRKGATKGKNLSQVDTYRRRIGEKEVRKAHTDKRIKESLHSKNTGSKSSKLAIILIALVIVAVFFALLYFVLFAALRPN